MKIIVSSIDWDYPGRSEGKPQPEHLPVQEIIDDPIFVANLAKDVADDKGLIAEYLTERYECCVYGFVAELEGLDIEKKGGKVSENYSVPEEVGMS